MISEAIDFRFLLLENYKKLKISEDQVVIILMVDHLLSQNNYFVTADLLSLKMSLDIKEIDRLVADLLTRGYIEYKTLNGRTVTSLDPLKEKLYREFQLSISKDNEVSSNEKVSAQLNNIFEQFQKELGRSLSPLEVSRIREWVSLGYSDETIIDALKEAISQGKKSLRSVDKILLSWAKRDEIEKEGKTTLKSDWTENLEETIRIAKTPWLDEDDED